MEAKWKLSTPSFLAEAAAREESYKSLRGPSKQYVRAIRYKNRELMTEIYHRWWRFSIDDLNASRLPLMLLGSNLWPLLHLQYMSSRG
jgi:hypothetical protein